MGDYAHVLEDKTMKFHFSEDERNGVYNAVVFVSQCTQEQYTQIHDLTIKLYREQYEDKQ